MAYDYAYTGDSIFSYTVANSDQQAQMANGALSSALGFYTNKNYTRAISEFKRAAALDPSNTQSYNYMANAYQAMNKPDDAIKAYKESLAVDPTQDDVHVSLANVYLGQKKYAQAEGEYKTAIKLNPSSTLAPYTMGQMYQQQGRYSEAETQFRKVIRMSPNDPNPYYALGATLNKEGKYDEAVKQLQQAIKLRPNMAAAHLELGTAYGALGNTVDAQHEVDTLTKLDAAQGALLQKTIQQPKMIATGSDMDNMVTSLGPNSQVFALDPTLVTPGASAELTMTFYFDSPMDQSSVQDPNNWTLSKATGGAAGYYNNTMAIAPTEAYIPQNPTTVVYDPDKQTATVSFMLSQNSTGNATIDPSHMVFKFGGKDIYGKTMDPTADEYDGAAQGFF